ncbi:MAG: hypothetical protein RL033_4352, partial [Pseudomonadota bacterium]
MTWSLPARFCNAGCKGLYVIFDCADRSLPSWRRHRRLGLALSLALGAACTQEVQQPSIESATEQIGEGADKASTEGAPNSNDKAAEPGDTSTAGGAGAPAAGGGAGGTPGAAGASGASGAPGAGGAAGSPGAAGDTNLPSGPGPLPWSPAPALRNPVTSSDADLARQALTLLGSSAVGAQGSCRSCHALGRPTLTRWAQLTAEFASTCLSNAQLPDVASVDATLACFRQRAGKPGTRFTAQSFGVYAAAAQLPWFNFVFQHATPVATGTTTHAEFVTRVAMPLAGQPWTQAEFDVVAEWFARRLPGLFELVPEESGEVCTVGLAPELGSYLDELALSGWRAKNARVPLLMYGCGPGQSGSACLADLPRAGSKDFGAGWESLPGSQIRLLHDNSES